MEIGHEYKRADGKPFPFGCATGIFIGLTSGQQMPRFKLSGSKECFLNYQPTDENFIEIK